MTSAEQKRAARDFAEQWRGRGYEKGDTASFWRSLLGKVLGVKDLDDRRVLDFEQITPQGGFIDVWLRDVGVMVEQKKIGTDLDQPEKRSMGNVTPYQQVASYARSLKLREQPRYLLTCSFETFRVYDREQYDDASLEEHPFEFTLEEFGEHPEYLGFIVDPENSRLVKEQQVSIKAGGIIGRLYDKMRSGYPDPDSEKSMHDLNVLCVRLVFCLYCEDAGLFPKDAFYNYLLRVEPGDIRMKLKHLFKVLDRDRPDRDPLDESTNVFPYVDGGLFRDEIEVPNFDKDMKSFLLDDASSELDWSQISPTVFGGIFESTLNEKIRREGGMHYTSPENIHKVIDPLFLDDLKAELSGIIEDGTVTPRTRSQRLRRYLRKLASMTFFDPACGSGNFLTETYLCLRNLEDRALDELRGGQTAMAFSEGAGEERRVSLDQFYGIEINDFAVSVAETALWISRLKANYETMMLLDVDSEDLPLKESAHIHEGNALRMDWNDVLPAEKCCYVIGNPPFKGAHSSEQPRTAEQTADLISAFDGQDGIADADYVAAWFAKASNYTIDTDIRCAFVATNSIGQGQQPSLIWPYLWERGMHFDFAYEPFLWGSEASDNAAVAVTIVGFSSGDEKGRAYFETDYRSGEVISASSVENIGPYLRPGTDEFVPDRSKPLCRVPEMRIGSQPIDKGNYIFKPDELANFLSREPGAKKFVHEFWGSREFLNGKKRYVLWLGEATPEELDALPLCRERIEKVRKYRLESKRASTKRAAEHPEHFGTEIISTNDSIIVPEVSSENRMYIPLGFISPDVFCSNKLRLIANGTLYMFGVLHSQFHNAWMRAVAGRLENRYSYSSGIVYNNFIWPGVYALEDLVKPVDRLVLEDQRAAIERTAQGILDARANHPDSTLADLYDPDKMPADLRAAHDANDAAVEAAYDVDFAGDEEKIVAHLFGLYANATEEEKR